MDAVRRNEIREAVRKAALCLGLVGAGVLLVWTTLWLGTYISGYLAVLFGAAWLFPVFTLGYLHSDDCLEVDAAEMWRLFKGMVARARRERSFQVLRDEDEDDDRPPDAKVLGINFNPHGDTPGRASHGGNLHVEVIRRHSGKDAGVWFLTKNSCGENVGGDGDSFPLSRWFQDMMEEAYERARDLQEDLQVPAGEGD